MENDIREIQVHPFAVITDENESNTELPLFVVLAASYKEAEEKGRKVAANTGETFKKVLYTYEGKQPPYERA